MAKKVDPIEVLKVNNHLLWPWVYWLPLVRWADGQQQYGVIHWQAKTKVYTGVNLFTIKGHSVDQSIPITEYESVEAMLAEWQVD